MEKISIKDVHKYCTPSLFGLVVSKSSENTPNVMGLSWWTFVSNQPLTVLICISKKGKTCKNIQLSKEFTLCLPDNTISDKAWNCSISTGHSVNKIERFDINLTQSDRISTPRITESKVAFECKLVNEFDGGDHYIFLGEVQQSWGNETAQKLYAVDGYKAIKCIAENV